jgi:hypothetical protein
VESPQAAIALKHILTKQHPITIRYIFRENKKKVKQRSKSNFKTKEPARLKIKNLPLKRIAPGGRKK